MNEQDKKNETELTDFESAEFKKVVNNEASRCSKCDCSGFIRGNPDTYCGRCDHSWKYHR